jgi:hypothetical protein
MNMPEAVVSPRPLSGVESATEKFLPEELKLLLSGAMELNLLDSGERVTVAPEVDPVECLRVA